MEIWETIKTGFLFILSLGAIGALFFGMFMGFIWVLGKALG